MRGLGIHDGDLLVVGRSLAPTTGSVIIAVIDGDFIVKQLVREGGGLALRAANPAYKDILLGEGKELTVWGVIRWAIHKV